MNKFNFQTLFFIALAIAFTLSSCKKDSSLKDSDIPTTYNFENVNYSGQTARLAMMAEITTYMKTANVSGTVVTAAVLKDMFANENNPFTDAALNADAKDIESKTFAADVAKIKDYMDKLAALSGTTTVASAGVAGIATSGTSSYLVNENGVEYRELIEKSLMGALSYYQIAAVYTSADKIGDAVDNETVIAGEGTAMEHHWDEASFEVVEPVVEPVLKACDDARSDDADLVDLILAEYPWEEHAAASALPASCGQFLHQQGAVGGQGVCGLRADRRVIGEVGDRLPAVLANPDLHRSG